MHHHRNAVIGNAAVRRSLRQSLRFRALPSQGRWMGICVRIPQETAPSFGTLTPSANTRQSTACRLMAGRLMGLARRSQGECCWSTLDMPFGEECLETFFWRSQSKASEEHSTVQAVEPSHLIAKRDSHRPRLVGLCENSRSPVWRRTLPGCCLIYESARGTRGTLRMNEKASGEPSHVRSKVPVNGVIGMYGPRSRTGQFWFPS